MLHPKSREKLMYDDHKLERSEMYFTVLQLLRTFEEWVAELVPRIELSRDHAQHDLNPFRQDEARLCKVEEIEHRNEARAIIDANWSMLLSQAQRSQDDILKRVERIKQEVSSLRDGVGWNPAGLDGKTV